MELSDNRTFLYLTLLLALLLIAGTCGGLFFPRIYSFESPNWREQTQGQDITGLLVIAPLLILSSIRMFCNKKDSYFLLGGILLFLIYSYTIYCFALHFNSLFLLNCIILGLAFYLFLFLFLSIPLRAVKNWFNQQIPIKSTSLILAICAVGFALMWLKGIIPALLGHTIPKSITRTGLPTNPVYVLDLAILLPGMLIVAFLLWYRHALGYLMAPMLLIFSGLMTINISVLMVKTSNTGLVFSLFGTLLFCFAGWRFWVGLRSTNGPCF